MNQSAKNIQSGSWTARWGDHVVHLRLQANGWRAIVWRWTVGGKLVERTELDMVEGLPTALVATQWACGVLVTHGAQVLVDGQKMSLEAFLSFAPAPTVSV